MPAHRSMCYLHCGWTRLPGMDTHSGLQPGPWTHPESFSWIPRSPGGERNIVMGEDLPTPPPTGANCSPTLRGSSFSAHLHPQISLLSSPNLQPTDLCWRNGGQCRKSSMLVAQFAVHIELQGRAGFGRTSESQESRVCAPVSLACLLEVQCMHFAILPLVPHQHGPEGEVSMRTVPRPLSPS